MSRSPTEPPLPSSPASFYQTPHSPSDDEHAEYRSESPLSVVLSQTVSTRLHTAVTATDDAAKIADIEGRRMLLDGARLLVKGTGLEDVNWKVQHPFCDLHEWRQARVTAEADAYLLLGFDGEEARPAATKALRFHLTPSTSLQTHHDTDPPAPAEAPVVSLGIVLSTRLGASVPDQRLYLRFHDKATFHAWWSALERRLGWLLGVKT